MHIVPDVPVTAPTSSHQLPDPAQLSLLGTPPACGHDHVKRPTVLMQGCSRRGGGPLTEACPVPVVEPSLLS